jgi:hypothetical protein
MSKAASRKIGIFLTGFILLAWVAILPPSFSHAGMHELSDGEMSAVYAYGFSTFTLEGDLARVQFNNVTMSTWTEIQSMKMGFYNGKGTIAWDNDWTNVSMGTSGTDLIAKGLFIEAKFSNLADPANRQLEYVRIGTTNLTGTISANFNSFSGTLDDGVTNMSRNNLGASTITANGTGFYLSLERSGSQMGYSFHWVSATKTP